MHAEFGSASGGGGRTGSTARCEPHVSDSALLNPHLVWPMTHQAIHETVRASVLSTNKSTSLQNSNHQSGYATRSTLHRRRFP